MIDVKTLDWIALVLIIIGGLNWLVVGLTEYDFVGALFGFMSVASRIIYGLVGLAALYMIYTSFAKLSHCTYRPIEAQR
jgi:uncharacterized protein